MAQRFTDGTPCPPVGITGNYQYPPPQSHYFAPPAYQHVPNPYTTAYVPRAHQANGNSVFAHTIFEDEDTQNVQYTTELNAHVRKAKPRKRVSLMPVKEEGRKSIAIHEDATRTLSRMGQGDDTTTNLQFGISRSSMRQSITAQPPRRRRVSAILNDRLAAGNENTETAQGGDVKRKSILKKEARRRTIFIPDDTTVMTIHPGVAPATRPPRDDTVRGLRRQLSPDMGLDLVTLSEGPESPHPGVLKQTQNTKKPPRKSLAMPPKRAPLGLSKRTHQAVSFAEDIIGAPTGKENMAPGRPGKIAAVKPLDEMTKTRLSMAGLRTATPEKVNARMTASLATVLSPAKRKGTDSILDYSPKPTKLKTSRAAARAERVVGEALAQSHTVRFAAVVEEASPIAIKEKPKAKHHAPPLRVSTHAASSATQHKILSEDLAHPSLYEDNWLSHQEISLGQLLNDIFIPQQSFKEVASTKDLRKQFIGLYHDPAIPLLHKRLQASLLYGALSIPKDLLLKASRVRDDVGLKRKFLDLLVENYELGPLKAALEVIVGREVALPRLSGSGKASLHLHNRSGSTSSVEAGRDRSSTGSNASDTGERKARAERKAIERFIDAFLIKHEDAARSKGTIANITKSTEHKMDDFGSPAWAWRRTMLKTLMLILLLDKSKTSGTVKGCLFQTTSAHKSSTSTLIALSSLLLPSLGDIIRPLSHLNYSVSNVQYPLLEYNYHISNLATDLRDGVMLTRLVELMLFDKQHFTSTTSTHNFSDNTMTLSLPTGDMLTSQWTHDPVAEWILSQHLKFPCIGRPQKIYNIQIALSALSTLGGAAAKAAEGITAEDVVDGHRERTLSLLWAIVGYYGLGTLVDWKELKREVRHFRYLAKEKKEKEDIADGLVVAEPRDAGEAVEKAPSLKRCTTLLLAWAQSIAALQGLHVTNLTTSFSDQSTLGAVVDAYLPYFPAAPATSSTSSTATLAAKLKAIGCSAAFTELYTSSSTSIPSKSFTVSTLTFLASRLLPLSCTHRAASVIQRAVRQHQSKRNITRRVALARLAHHCAVVVQTRERVVGAATVLQRAWRKVLNTRIERLLVDIIAVQTMGRGWIAREKVRGGGVVKLRRVIGGW